MYGGYIYSGVDINRLQTEGTKFSQQKQVPLTCFDLSPNKGAATRAKSGVKFSSIPVSNVAEKIMKLLVIYPLYVHNCPYIPIISARTLDDQIPINDLESRSGFCCIKSSNKFGVRENYQ